jgi:PAS domain S-box-containing protein
VTTTPDRLHPSAETGWWYAAAVLVAVICCGLTVPSVLNAGRDRRQVTVATTAQRLARVGATSDLLLDAVLRERGHSQMYLAGPAPGDGAQLLDDRQGTDRAIRSWRSSVATAAGTLPESAVERIRRDLTELLAARPGISTRMPGMEVRLDTTTDLGFALIALSAKTAGSVEQLGIGMATRHISLLVAVRQLGLERRRIAGRLSAGKVTGREAVQIVLANRTGRLQALDIFTLLSTPAQATELTRIDSTGSARLLAEIETAIANGDRRRLDSVTATEWFSQSSVVLDAYVSMLKSENDLLQARVDRLVTESRTQVRLDLILTGTLLLAGLLVGLGLVARARRRATRADRRATQQARDDAVRIEAILSNSATEQIYGYRPDELVGQNVSMLMPDSVATAYAGHLDAYLAAQEELCIGRPRESTARRRDGSEVPLEVMTVRVQIGGRTLITSIARDITERKQALSRLIERDLEVSQQNVALARSNSELEQFASIASHDLQEPLRKITSYVHILETDYAAQMDDQGREYAKLTCSAAERMRLLINDLLALSRIREQSMQVSACDTRAIVAAILDDFEIALAECGAEVTVGDLPVLTGDQAHLRQVFQNVISNAVKYRGSSPPRIGINAQHGPEGWHFTVRDNGIGFRQEYADQIFGMFKRLVSRREYEGTGIGLAVVAKVVSNHGGRIWATSELGVGTAIEFILPDRTVLHPEVALIPRPRNGSRLGSGVS